MEEKITLRIDKDLKAKFKELCNQNNRSISNMLVTMIKKEVLNMYKDGTNETL